MYLLTTDSHCKKVEELDGSSLEALVLKDQTPNLYILIITLWRWVDNKIRKIF